MTQGTARAKISIAERRRVRRIWESLLQTGMARGSWMNRGLTMLVVIVVLAVWFFSVIALGIGIGEWVWR